MKGLFYQYLAVRFPRSCRLFQRRRNRKFIDELERSLDRFRSRFPSFSASLNHSPSQVPRRVLFALWAVEIADELITLTQETWSKRLGRPVAKDEAIDIIRNFRNFLILVKEVKNAQRPQH